MAIVGSNILAGASGQSAGGGGYQIERSLRFDSSSSSHLSRTPSADGNRTTWTWASWVKRSSTGNQRLFTAGSNGSINSMLQFVGNGTHSQFEVWNYDNGTNAIKRTLGLFRDFSAWYHIVVSCTSSTLKIYVNGVEAEYESGSNNVNPSGGNWTFNNQVTHTIGRTAWGSEYFDGYLADVHFIDGQALDPTDFGEFDATTGAWNPIEYTGSYPGNSFHLDFSDNSTVSALGTDASPNGNNWSANNFKTTVGTVYATGTHWTTSTAAAAAYEDGASTTPYVIDITGNYTSATPRFAYSGGFDNMFDGTDSYAYILNDYNNMSTYSFLVDLRDFLPVTSVSVRGFAYNSTIGGYYYSPYKAQLLDANKNYISNTDITIGTSMSDHTVPVYGTPRYLKIYRSGGNYDRGYIAGFNINGTRMVNVGAPQDEDCLFDSPTNGTQADTGAGGEVSGNFSCFNPLAKYSSTTLSNGNLHVYSSNVYTTLSTIAFPAEGKFYAEFTINGTASGYPFVGIGGFNDTGIQSNSNPNTGAFYAQGGYITGSVGVSSLSALAAGDIIGVAYDASTGKTWFSRNGTYVNSGDPAAGTNQTCTLSANSNGLAWAVSTYSSGTVTLNAGQRAFKTNAPSGFKCLCTANLPDPTIADGSTAMDIALYTGNGTSQTISGLSFTPDFAWFKSRSGAENHVLSDTVRGSDKQLFSNLTNAEQTNSTYVTSFTSDGFSLGSNTGTGGNNINGTTYVAWTWDGGSSTVSNTDGSITSSVRANASAGFSIVKWTSIPWTGSAANRQVGHGLGAAPAFIITKGLDNAASWYCYHKDLDASNPEDWYITLNNTNARGNLADSWGPNKPDSTTFGDRLLGWSDGQDVIAYCWAPVEGYSAIGSWTGSTDLPFIYTGFRVKFLLAKRAVGGTGDWIIQDATRTPSNGTGDNNTLVANVSNSEDGYYTSSQVSIDYLSNGFKLRHTGGPLNDTGSTYIYIAFGETPQKFSRAR